MPADHGTPTGGDERRAEIEAVAEALSWADTPDPGGRVDPNNYTGLATAAIRALDRVRDARNDEVAVRRERWHEAREQAEADVKQLGFRRSPQGEDHDPEKLARLLGKIADRAKYLGEAAWTEEGTMLVGRQIHAWAFEALALAVRYRDALREIAARDNTWQAEIASAALNEEEPAKGRNDERPG